MLSNTNTAEKLNEVYYQYVNNLDSLNILTQELLDTKNKKELNSTINTVKEVINNYNKETFFRKLESQYKDLKNVVDNNSKFSNLLNDNALSFLDPNKSKIHMWYGMLSEFLDVKDGNAHEGISFIADIKNKYLSVIKELDSAIERLTINDEVNHDTYKKLQEVYPEVDEKFLYETANRIGDKTKDLGEKIDVTGSKIVIPIVTKDGIDYFKGSDNKDVIVKESEWINFAKQNYLTRIANASMKTSINSKNYSGIITKGTQNEFNADEYEDFKKYIVAKQNILGSYARANNLDIAKLSVDPVVASVFNTAINHVFIGPNVDNKVLAKSYNKRIKDFEELEQRAKNTFDKDAFNEFRELKDNYNSNLERFNDQEDIGSKIIIHGDNRPGNLGIEQPNRSYFLGRKIDFGAARPGYVSEDLAKLETIDNGAYVSLYNHIVKELGGINLNNSNLTKKIDVESNLNDVRSLSFVLSKNNFESAKRYFGIIKQKNKRYKVA